MSFKTYRVYGLNDVLPFGKYKGEAIRQILESDPEYIIWITQHVSTCKMSKTVEKIAFQNTQIVTALNCVETPEYLDIFDMCDFGDR